MVHCAIIRTKDQAVVRCIAIIMVDSFPTDRFAGVEHDSGICPRCCRENFRHHQIDTGTGIIISVRARPKKVTAECDKIVIV
jgi:hypothetical protein